MMRLAWTIARRELRGGLRGFRIFLACLALGVGAIAAVGSVRGAIDDGLAREGATLLGGDAELRLTYRFATAEERAWIDSFAAQVSEIVDFRSMAVRADGEERSVTQVKGVDAAYPLVGAVGLDPAMPLPTALNGQDGLPGAVMERILADRLGLAIGDRFRLGVQEFVLMAHITREPDGVGGNFGFGPRTLVRTDALAGAELLSPGTLYDVNYRLLLPGLSLDDARATAEAQFDGAGVRWRDSRNAAPQVRRVIDRVSSFLVLVGLAGLAVGGVGVSAAVRTYLESKTKVIATLKTLGAESRTIFAVYLMQIGVLTGLGLAIGLALGAIVPFAIAPFVTATLPVPLDINVQPSALLEAAIYGILTALIFTLWPLARTEQVRAATIFREAGAAGAWPRLPYLLVIGALVVALVGIAAAFASVPMLAFATAGGVIGALAILALAALGLRTLARRAARARALRGYTALRMAMGAISNPREGASAVVLSLGLGLTVLAAVGQIDSNLRRAIATDLPDRAPSYFFLDIQNTQLQGFLDRLAQDPDVTEVQTAPMLRGVVTALNGIPSRDHPAAGHWVLRGDRGVSYSATLPQGTELTAGDWWAADYSGPPLVSFAQEEAVELGLNLGDTVTVNILGRDITATIASFRNVDFSTGGIGFVMVMSPQPVSAAPHTHIATVYAEQAAEGAILRDLSNMFPNITAIRVREAAERVTEAFSTMATATSYAALATLITGFVVLIGAAAAGERARVFESAVMKTLGASRARILTSFALRAALMGAAAGVVALGAGALASWGVMTLVMETSYVFEPLSAIGVILGGVFATLAAGLIFALRPLAARPASVLRAQD